MFKNEWKGWLYILIGVPLLALVATALVVGLGKLGGH
jgi:hypothetical protein